MTAAAAAARRADQLPLWWRGAPISGARGVGGVRRRQARAAAARVLLWGRRGVAIVTACARAAGAEMKYFLPPPKRCHARHGDAMLLLLQLPSVLLAASFSFLAVIYERLFKGFRA